MSNSDSQGATTDSQTLRPESIIPPGSPCGSLNDLTPKYNYTSFKQNRGCTRVSADGDEEVDSADEESATEIIDSLMSPDNQKLAKLLTELAGNDKDYVGSEIISEFAVWEKVDKTLDGTSQSPDDKPVLYVRDDGTPTPGTFAPFWNKTIVRSLINVVTKDAPGSRAMGKKNPITVCMHKEKMYAVNSGLHYFHDESVLELICGETPCVQDPVEEQDVGERGSTIQLTHQQPKKSPTAPLQCYMSSEYPAYLVLEYHERTPTLKSINQSELTKRIEEGSKKFNPLITICKVDAYHDWKYTVALYFKDDQGIHFVHVDPDTKKLKIVTCPKEAEIQWRKHLQFKEKIVSMFAKDATKLEATPCNGIGHDTPDSSDKQPIEWQQPLSSVGTDDEERAEPTTKTDGHSGSLPETVLGSQTEQTQLHSNINGSVTVGGETDSKEGKQFPGPAASTPEAPTTVKSKPSF